MKEKFRKKLREKIQEIGEKINDYNCKPIENIYYILCSIVYGEQFMENIKQWLKEQWKRNNHVKYQKYFIN